MSNNKRAPSEEFMDAVCHAYSPVIECELCGRIHYAPNTDLDFEPGELEELETKHKEDPDKYIPHSSTLGVRYGILDGKQVADGCPCTKAVYYERLFWNSRWIIADFFKAIQKKREKITEGEGKLVRDIENSLD